MADFETEVVATTVEVTYVDLDGGAGPQGRPGTDGWTPTIANVADGDRIVMQIVGYTGGEGTPPDNVGQYVGVDGPVDDPADALDIRGLQGLQGEKGDKGEDGQILIGGGANIFTEPRDPLPDNSEGEDGDLWINTDTNDIFSKVLGVWQLQSNIKGQPGVQGPQGNPGAPGNPGAAGVNGWTPVPALVVDGVRLVIQIVDYTGGTGTKPPVPRYVGAAGPTTDIAQAVNIRGTTGAPGSNGVNGLSVYSGPDDPAANLGVLGEVFINTTTSGLWRKEGTPAAWVLKLTLKGADSTVPGPQGQQGPQGQPGVQGPPGADSTVPGPPGAPGAAFLSGTTNPSDALGANGDAYANVLTGDVWKKASGSWGSPVGSLKGNPGQQGVQGNPGTRGSVWFMAPGNPGSVPGAIALDNYVNTTTGDVFQYTGSVWANANFNIKGVQGDPGTPGAQGNPGTPGAQGSGFLIGTGAPSNAVGIQGDTYLNRTTGDLYGPKGASAWPAPSGTVKGDPGTPGSAGADGLSVLSGAGAPANGLGRVGDIYVDLNTQDLYKKTGASAWTLAFNMKGAPGAPGSPGSPGDPGSPGATIYSGAGAPSNALGLINDFYLNTSSSDLFKKTDTSVWTLQVNLKGATGSSLFDLAFFFPGKQISANQLMARVEINRQFRLEGGMTAGIFRAGVAPTNSVAWTLRKAGTTIATFTWAAGSLNPVITGSAATTNVSFAWTDTITIVGAATPDATFADVSMQLGGVRGLS